jgi:hypothetical protein
MKQILLLAGLLLLSIFSKGQIAINELDSDSPGTDTKEFIELLTDAPNMSLDGYIVVLYNGSNNLSYETFDLAGYSSDANGLFVLGTSDISPTPNVVFDKADNVIQNGADAAAIYHAAASSFPNGTSPTTLNLIAALVYDTNDSDDEELLQGLNQTIQYNEGENGDKDNHSLQRKADGTYEAKEPTPGALNDGGGVELPTITISTTAAQYEEGASFDLVFTASETVTSDLMITFTLENGSFNSADFTGNLSVTIPTGTNSGFSTIALIDDTENEGDETLIVQIVNLDESYQALNSGYSVKVIDNDFTVSLFGTPVSPTYGQVSSTAPEGYYDNLNGLSGQALKDAITDLIANPSVVRAQTYGDIWDILKEADQNPANNNEVWLLYIETGRAKSEQQSSGSSVGKWNREHVYPQSRGGFSDGTPTYSDGIDVYMNTSSAIIDHGHSDAHSLRPADGTENTRRGNDDYGDATGLYSGPDLNSGSWKGDVARSLMFMALRYDALTLVSGNPDNTTVGAIGDLSYLLQWHATDQPDDYEMNRNNVIYTWQVNRNPFIDIPELVDYVFGDKQGDLFNLTLPINNPYQPLPGRVFPNPVTDQMNFSGVENGGVVSVYDYLGHLVFEKEYNEAPMSVSSLSPGIYIYRIKNKSGSSFYGKFLKKVAK